MLLNTIPTVIHDLIVARQNGRIFKEDIFVWIFFLPCFKYT